MDASDLLRCQFSRWYPAFQKHSFKSTIIPVDKEFVDYLISDGIHVKEQEKEDIGSEPVDEALSDQEEALENHRDISEKLRCSLEAVIQEYGAVAPKFTWSSPKDATWISFSRTLKCTSVDDVLILLKASDAIVHDICHVFDDVYPEEEERTRALSEIHHSIALRKWYELDPSMEFRCFVKHGHLFGVAQRQCAYFRHLFDMQNTILQLIEAFIVKFSPHLPSSNVVMDVYIQMSNRKVFVVDFQPLDVTSSSPLIDWKDIEASQNEQVLPWMRLFESEAHANSALESAGHLNQYPIEAVGAAMGHLNDLSEQVLSNLR